MKVIDFLGTIENNTFNLSPLFDKIKVKHYWIYEKMIFCGEHSHRIIFYKDDEKSIQKILDYNKCKSSFSYQYIRN